jgi:hypothetical protein
MPRNRTLRYIFSRAKQFLVTLVAVLGGATALNADVIYSLDVAAPTLGPKATVTASATLPDYINSSLFAFPPGSSSFSDAPEVASVTFFAQAGILWSPNALVQFPFLLYTDPEGHFHNLGYNDGNITSFSCFDGSPCTSSTNVSYRDSDITAGFSTIGTVTATFAITSTAVPEPGALSLLSIGLVPLWVLIQIINRH